MNEKSKWIKKIPILLSSTLVILSFYFFLRVWIKGASLVVGQIKRENIYYGWGLFGKTYDVGIISVLSVSLLVCFTWLLSTRISIFQQKKWRVMIFIMTILTVWGNLSVYGMNYTKNTVIPFFQERLEHVVETDSLFKATVLEQTEGFYLMLLLIPTIVMLFISLFLINKYIQFDKELNKAFFEFEWRGRWLQIFSRLELDEYWPDIELGVNSKTGEMVILPGKDRTLNTSIIGPVGTGKSAALGLPIINQDLHHMVNFINVFPKIYKRPDYLTENVVGRNLNGLSIIDPSNDLCQKSLQLVKAHGIPDEAITYINPLDPNTPSINPMRGPVDKVAEVFAQVISGLSDSKDGGNFFFEQAQRNHLKQYIYLLKLHDPNIEVTFDMLLDMYNNPQLVREMHVKLKRTLPNDIDDIDNRDLRNYWKIVQGVDEWFDLNLLPLKDQRGNPEVTPEGERIYFDAEAVNVKGLRNILNDIGANPLIRRVLFGKSDFDFDRHMAIGGVLLVNTAKGELVNLARVLGKIVLMNLQTATFRRPPNVSPYHHILVDEAPDYLYNAFREFPAQSRKYKVIITTLKQTIAQLSDQYGEHYMTTLIASMRNRMIYGDAAAYDAEYFSKMFGEKQVYEEGQSEQSVSPLQDSPLTRSGSSYSKVREQSMTAGDIMYQEAFQCAVKIVQNNKPMPVVQIQANFVPKEEFVEAKVKADKNALNVWLQQRREFSEKNISVENTDASNEILQIKSIEESEEEHAEYYEKERNNAFSLDEEEMEKVLSVRADPRPRDPINYSVHNPPVTPIQRKKENEEFINQISGRTEGNDIEGEMQLSEIKNDYTQSEPPESADKLVKSLTASLIEDYEE